MKNITTRFMSRLFSATEEGDEELTAEVAQDIQDAKKLGAVDTDEVRYENNNDGTVSVIDKGNGEVTIAEQAEDGNFDLYAAPTPNVEGFLHPEVAEDGEILPGDQQGVPAEDVWDHVYNQSAEDADAPCDGDDCDEREFSVATDNSVVLKIFSDQEFCERVFSEVLESEETANVGDLKIEKVDDDAVVVTSKTTGDQAKVTLSDDEMQVDELSAKDGGDERSFCDGQCGDDEAYEPLQVVGVDVDNHVIINAPEYDSDSALDLVNRLSEQGIEGVRVFETEDEAREYADDLLESLGAENEDDIEEPVQTEFSDHVVYCTKFYSSRTNYMERLYSEAENCVETSQAEIEDAIENGEEIENDNEIITPIDSETALVEDKETGEFTKITLDDDTLDCKAISKSEAEDLVKDLEIEDEDDDDEEDDDEERDFSDLYEEYEQYFSALDDDDLEEYLYSDVEEDDEDEDEDRLYSDVDDDIYSNEEQTKFFSESEAEFMTEYQQRLFSGEADEKDIEDAIEEGEQIENDDVVITPVSEDTAIIEDKKNGEFTKAVMDDDTIDVTPISEEEADDLTDGLRIEDKDTDEDEKDDEKNFSENPVLDKFFADIQQQNQQGGDNVTPLYDENGNLAPIGMDGQGNPVAVDNSPADAADGAQKPSVEVIEDTADQAVNLIQQAAQEMSNQILQAKQAPVAGEEQDLQEAQFSEYELINDCEDPLQTWLSDNQRKF